MERRATIITDLGFGDAGKGSVVDYLARESKSAVVVRYNGGPQAAHNVITADGRHHTFAQFGSGSFVPGVRTYLSRDMLINPFNVFAEANQLLQLGVHDIWLRTAFDEDALVITPFHVAANQLRELARGDGRHGSCGQGIGETRSLDIRHPDTSIRISDLYSVNELFKQLQVLQSTLRMEIEPLWPAIEPTVQSERMMRILSEASVISDVYRGFKRFARTAHISDMRFFDQLAQAHDHLIFEGAQGVLLDEKYGFHPHTTWSNTTNRNALKLLEDVDYDNRVSRLGLIRGYGVRHGAGPFVTEDEVLSETIQDYHNLDNEWQRAFRVGYPDLVSMKYGAQVAGGVDELAVTNLDRMKEGQRWKIASGYKLPKRTNLDELFEIDGGVAVGIKFKAEKDLGRQEAITTTLLGSKPIYQGVETPSGGGRIVSDEDVESYLDFLSRELNTPITLTSTGPMAANKKRLLPTFA